jgi:hypothetical protein
MHLPLTAFGLLWVSLATAVAADVTSFDPPRGTKGTEIAIAGSGLSPTGKKPKLKVLLDGEKARGTALKVLTFSDTAITGVVSSAKPGLYDVTVEPKKGTPTTLVDAFEVCLIENVVATPQGGAPGDTVTLCGNCMPVKAGSVKIGKKSAKRLAWTAASTDPCSPQGRIDVRIPKLEDGTYDITIKTSVGTTVVPGGLQVGGDVPVEDEILQAMIDGIPFESTPPNLLVTYNDLGGIYSVFAQSDTPGDDRTLQFTILFNPDVQKTGTFTTLPQVTMTYVAGAGGNPFVLDADPMTFLTTGRVDVTGNTLGKVVGTFEADLIESNGGAGSATIRDGVFAVRETQ